MPQSKKPRVSLNKSKLALNTSILTLEDMNQSNLVHYDNVTGISVFRKGDNFLIVQNENILYKSKNARTVKSFLESFDKNNTVKPICNIAEEYSIMDFLSSLGLAPDEETAKAQSDYKNSTYSKECVTWNEYFGNKGEKQVGVNLGTEGKSKEISTGGEGVKLTESVHSSNLFKLGDKFLEYNSSVDEGIEFIKGCSDANLLVEFAYEWNFLQYILQDKVYSLSELEDIIDERFEDEVSLPGKLNALKDLSSWTEHISGYEEPKYRYAWYMVDSENTLQCLDDSYVEDIKNTIVEYLEDAKYNGAETMNEV